MAGRGTLAHYVCMCVAAAAAERRRLRRLRRLRVRRRRGRMVLAQCIAQARNVPAQPADVLHQLLENGLADLLKLRERGRVYVARLCCSRSAVTVDGGILASILGVGEEQLDAASMHL